MHPLRWRVAARCSSNGDIWYCAFGSVCADIDGADKYHEDRFLWAFIVALEYKTCPCLQARRQVGNVQALEKVFYCRVCGDPQGGQEHAVYNQFVLYVLGSDSSTRAVTGTLVYVTKTGTHLHQWWTQSRGLHKQEDDRIATMVGTENSNNSNGWE